MARRRELLDITHAISGSFNSRNNDFNGCWALGFLYKSTSEINIYQLEFDLLKCEIKPNLTILQPIINQYHSLLCHLLETKKIQFHWVKQATISIHFNQYDKIHHDKMLHPVGDPYVSICNLMDDMGKTYQSTYYGKCLFYSPNIK